MRLDGREDRSLYRDTRGPHLQRRTNMAKTIGAITTYDGNEHPYLRGHNVRIVAGDEGRRGAGLRPRPRWRRPPRYDDVERAGGVTAADRIEVQPWLEREQRWSFVTSDPRAIDLACFKRLARTKS
jgi:hypothetical protein